MKKIIFTLLLSAALAVTAQAQERKFWVGGSLGFESTELKTNSSSHDYFDLFSFEPEFGYAFSDRWAAGLRLGLGYAKFDGAEEVKADLFSIAPFARYIFLRWKAFSVFADGGLTYSYLNGDMGRDFISSRAGMERTDCRIFIDPGFSLRLSDCMSLTGATHFFSGSYSRTSFSSDEEMKSWSADLNSPFDLGDIEIGIEFEF